MTNPFPLHARLPSVLVHRRHLVVEVGDAPQDVLDGPVRRQEVLHHSPDEERLSPGTPELNEGLPGVAVGGGEVPPAGAPPAGEEDAMLGVKESDHLLGLVLRDFFLAGVFHFWSNPCLELSPLGSSGFGGSRSCFFFKLLQPNAKNWRFFMWQTER